jgi:hypothetical protein
MLIPKVPASAGNIVYKAVCFIKWNYLLTFTFSNYQNLVLYWLIEWVSLRHVEQEVEKASVALTVIFLFVIFVPVVTYFITRKVYRGIQNDKNKSKLSEVKIDSPPISPQTIAQTEQQDSHPVQDSAKEPVKKPEEQPPIPDQFASIYDGIQTGGMLPFMYLTICAIRGLFHFAFMATLTDYPFAQCILITLVNITMLTYMIKARPLNTVINNVKLFGVESIIFTTYLLALILAGHDYVGDSDIDRRMKIGHGIVILNVIFYYWSLIFQGLDALWSVWVIVKAKLEERKQAAADAQKKKEQDALIKDNAKEGGETEKHPMLEISPTDKGAIVKSESFTDNGDIANENIGPILLTEAKMNNSAKKSNPRQ